MSDRILNTEDGTLDAFIRDYCESNNIECDGGIFSMAFTLICQGKLVTDFSEREAVMIIKESALAYDLYLTGK